MTMYLGIDLSKATLTATLLDHPQHLLFFGVTLANTEAGFRALLQQMTPYTDPATGVYLMENTGVYGEKLCYFLSQQGLTPHVEPAHYIRRAFRLKRKTDPVDSRMIAEYGYRYPDQLHPWTPPSPLVEHLRVLLSYRELLVKEKTAHVNATKALQQKMAAAVFSPTHQAAIGFFASQIKLIEKQMNVALKTDAQIRQHFTNLRTIPGCGRIYGYHFCLVTEGFRQVNYRNLAGYLGICPHEYESGTSVYKKPTSDRKGPERMRKQLYLSAMAAIRKNSPYRAYYERKKAEGKPHRLILNNLANKILRVSCAVILSMTPYHANYKSLHRID